jgi:hypothetical protein
MDRRTIIVTLALLLVASLTAASPSTAKTTRTPVDVFEISCIQIEGMTWTSGEMFHLRGRVSQSVLYDPTTLEELGGNLILGNVNLNLTTGNGIFFGTSSGIYL